MLIAVKHDRQVHKEDFATIYTYFTQLVPCQKVFQILTDMYKNTKDTLKREPSLFQYKTMRNSIR